ncbi:MAG: lipid A biosynthesis acyltransferase [Planctomycetes bacterium]|nr:lipid A biosynthesis acyltransferase [Planctomycetota bacterium]
MTESTWLNQRERGTLLLIRITIRLATMFGRRAVRPLVVMIALWYRLFDKNAVRASRDWLRRAHGSEPGFWAIYRHIRTFAQVTLDRVFLVTGRTRGFAFTSSGHDNLVAQMATGHGAVLLGAHVGSFEAMRGRSFESNLRIQVLGYFKNARMINALLEQLSPERNATVIHLGDDPVGTMARVRARLDDGDFVALLGDRTGLNERTTTARFFGEEARFPSGPFLLASLLRCPVYLVFGLYREPNRYDLSCELFAERIDLPRRDRERGLQAAVQRFADRLEERCRSAPDNWFNFYDFWSKQ